jgi:hypothetical protein
MRDRTEFRGDRHELYARVGGGLARLALFRRRIAERDGWVCGICRKPVDRADIWHLDHIVPKSQGGPDTWDNLRLAHARCNISRGDCSRDVLVALYLEAGRQRELQERANA